MTADTIHQKILPNHQPDIPLRRFSRRHAGIAVEGLNMRLWKGAYVGLAMQRSPKGRVESLALATIKEVIVISLESDKPELLTFDKPFEVLLRGDSYTLVAFNMERLALRLAEDLKLHVRGVDLTTAFRANNWDPPLPSDVIKTRLFQGVNVAQVDEIWINQGGMQELCFRAWLPAWHELICLTEIDRQAFVLDSSRPKEVPSEFVGFKVTEDGALKLQNARYKTKVRKGPQTVIMTNESGQEFCGQARGAKGRTTSIRFTERAFTGTLTKVRVFGPPPLTNPEKARDELVRDVLQGQASLGTLFIKLLWFFSRKIHNFGTLSAAGYARFPKLNESQESVASRMLSDEPILVAHGPPGTGKTTTIAAAVSVWAQKNLPTWIIAHSNVAVKNMAQALFRTGVPFRILVSKDFHFEWHEHIYENIEEKVIVSDEILGVRDVCELERILGPQTCIILSTLSMLSNPSLSKVGMFQVVPVGRLVVDEASQIKIEDYLVDRMPAPLGNFISKYVYDGRLKSEHSIQIATCVTFVDVPSGAEIKSGFSWMNFGEIQVMINLVKSYYRHTNFCIITPYDAQRSAIESELKKENLPWEHGNQTTTCANNADRMILEGNEADFVLVSVVRSGNGPGFLSSKNRMNVLLTRCRKGLVVVTSRSFMQGGGRHTLLGYLERHWMGILGNSTWVEWRAISDGTADLPGAPGPNRARAQSRVSHVPGVEATHVPPIQRSLDVESLFTRPLPKVRIDATNQLSKLKPIQTWSPVSSPLTNNLGTIAAPSSTKSTANAWRLAASTVHRGDDYDATFPALRVISMVPVGKKLSSNSAFSLRREVQPKQATKSRESHTQATNAPVVRRLKISSQQRSRAHPERLLSDLIAQTGKKREDPLKLHSGLKRRGGVLGAKCGNLVHTTL
ncbi:hypothetical protein H0H87_006136 [Tephrocybe sp. NHM501043]|nr:hypothetical protein H0H87_006136 [Tephrocybe sp. NHM501043]